MPSWFSTYWFSYSTLQNFVWANPKVLYGIFGIPFLFLLRTIFHGNSRQRVELPFVYANIQQSWISYLRFILPIIFGFAIACILLALARPQKPVIQQDTFQGIDIILTLDISESMLEKDFSPNRLEAAKTIIKNFIKNRKKDRIGLVVFAGKAYSFCPLTNDYELILEYIQDINANLIETAGTAIGDALAVGINRMREMTSKSKVIILLSDGESLEGNLPPNIAAQLAKKFNVKVYAIGIGKKKSGENQVNTQALSEISKITKGKFFNADNSQTLSLVFKEIDKIEKQTLQAAHFQPMEDFYHIYINWAIAAILATLLLKSTFMGNIFED